MIKIATWNVNSIKARLPNVLKWLDSQNPDVVLFQEIKTVAETFPYLEFEERGYNMLVCGQKSYNGVAILSKFPLENKITSLIGNEADKQARYAEAVINGNLKVASIYLPNGNPIESDKFPYKLEWLERLLEHVKQLMSSNLPFVLGGDFNVILNDKDVYSPKAFADTSLCHTEVIKKMRSILNLGLTDALRAFNKQSGVYSFWDYKHGCWQKDNGILLDYLLLSPEATDMLKSSGIDKEPRGWERPSDHAPVWCELAG